MFYFLGKGPYSKSLLLRALVTQSYFPTLRIMGASKSDDVLNTKTGLKCIQTGNKQQVFCGSGAAPLRFLALRASRENGYFTLKCTKRLLHRPQEELQSLLQQLGSKVSFKTDSLIIQARGWKFSGDALTVNGERSSQFASALLLNSWNCSQDIYINIEGKMRSHSYFQMTLSFLRQLGMRIEGEYGEYYIPKGQKIKHLTYQIEQDMSCLFAIAACTVKGGQATFKNWPATSLQPDFIFPTILEKIGFQVQQEPFLLKIHGCQTLHPLHLNLDNTPDLFPVLTALCALAKGKSQLTGAKQLQYKESNRITAMADLLKNIGRKTQILEDGLIIYGQPLKEGETPMILFDPKEDHRLAMAAGILKQAGAQIKILNPEVVNKSFPDFWQTTGISP